MRTNGATWKAYLDSWPEGQWFDDCDATVNGTHINDIDEKDIPDTAQVTFTCGAVFVDENDQEGFALPAHFRRWQKSLTHVSLVISIPKDKQDELKAFLQSIKGSISN